MCAVLVRTSETMVRASLQVWYMRRVSSLRRAEAWLSSISWFCEHARIGQDANIMDKIAHRIKAPYMRQHSKPSRWAGRLHCHMLTTYLVTTCVHIAHEV